MQDPDSDTRESRLQQTGCLADLAQGLRLASPEHSSCIGILTAILSTAAGIGVLGVRYPVYLRCTKYRRPWTEYSRLLYIRPYAGRRQCGLQAVLLPSLLPVLDTSFQDLVQPWQISALSLGRAIPDKQEISCASAVINVCCS